MKKILFLSTLLCMMAGSLFAQRSVSGKVTSAEDGSPIPGVVIVVKGSTTGAATDIDGGYRINNVADGAVLIFSYVGFTGKEIAVGTQSVIDVVLEPDVKTLSEIVVVGYGTQLKKDLTGSLTSISSSDFASLPTPSFDQQLAGRAAGVQVTTTSGVIGAAPRIRIRGTNSISSGASPLVVVDNVPMITGNQSGATPTNPLGDINPADIESIEILKDGAATAIYGSRAANGVILITTKRGKAKGGARVNYEGVVGFNSAVNRFDMLNANEFIEIANEKFGNAGQPPQAFPGPDNVNTDWQDVIFQTGVVHNHNLNISGGSDNTSYFFSVGYQEQNGALVSNSQQRYTFRSNIDHQIGKRIKVGKSLSYARTVNNGLNTGTNALSGNLIGAARLLPNVRVMNPDHPTGFNITPDGAALGRDNNLRPVENNFTNQAFVLANNQLRALSNRILGNAYGELNLFDGLKFRTQIGIDMTMTESFLSYDPRHGDGRGVNGLVSQTFRDVTLWNVQNYFSYNKRIGDSHNISAVAGMEAQKTTVRSFTAGGQNFSEVFFIQENLITGTYATQTSSGLFVPTGFDSYFGRLNYTFKDKYLLGFSVRNDGISSLPEANRRGTFIGASAGYRISAEEFFKNASSLSFISDLKLRASYAQVGNVDIGAFPFLGTFGAAQYASQTGIGFTNTGNPELQWEASTKTNIGLDMGLWDDRITVGFDYFNNDVSQLVLNAPTAPSLGIPGNSISRNIGAMWNRGVELSINAVVINKGDFRWNVNFNYANIQNQITALNNNEDILFTYHINRVGHPIGAFYGFTWAGVNPANGNPMWVKGDGNIVQYNIPTNQYRLFNPANPADISQASSLSAVADRSIVGNSNPIWQGGFINNFRYKGFDLELFFRYSGGNDILNVTRQATLLNMGFQNNGREILDRWREAGQQTNVPRLWWGREAPINNTGATDTRFLENGNFLRLQNLVLGYTLPTSVLNTISKNSIRNARVFFQAQNLLTFSKYSGLDPELSDAGSGTNSTFGVDNNTNPIIRTVSFGLSLGL